MIKIRWHKAAVLTHLCFKKKWIPEMKEKSLSALRGDVSYSTGQRWPSASHSWTCSSKCSFKSRFSWHAPLRTQTRTDTHTAAAGWFSYFYFNFTEKTTSIKEAAEAALWVWCCVAVFILFFNINSENQDVTAQNSFNKQKDKNSNKGNSEFFGPPAALTAEQTEFVWKRRFPIGLRRWIFFHHTAVYLC